VREVLANYSTAFRFAERAARRDHCDWETPPLTIQLLPDDLGLGEIQSLREVANLLAIQCRLEIADCQFDQAIHTLQTGFALARHVAEGTTLLKDLVGIAIEAIMFARVEELLQQPGAPNLYWALTTLPHPFVDVRRSMRYELGTLYRSFPQLRDLEEKKLTAEQVDRL